MEIHENSIVHPFTLICPNFSKDRACVDLVGKKIPILVIYLPLVTFLCADHFLTSNYSVEFYAHGIVLRSVPMVYSEYWKQSVFLELQ
jgi:hypothetical protein